MNEIGAAVYDVVEANPKSACVFDHCEKYNLATATQNRRTLFP